jgi:hypothetical protein
MPDKTIVESVECVVRFLCRYEHESETWITCRAHFKMTQLTVRQYLAGILVMIGNDPLLTGFFVRKNKSHRGTQPLSY